MQEKQDKNKKGPQYREITEDEFNQLLTSCGHEFPQRKQSTELEADDLPFLK